MTAFASTGVGYTPASAAARGVTAATVLLGADVHLELLTTNGFGAIPMIGPLFWLNVVAGFVIGIAVVVWRHWLPVLASIGFGAATLVAFLLSATVGLFGLKEQLFGSAQLVAGISELLAVVAGIVVLVLERHRYAKTAGGQ